VSGEQLLDVLRFQARACAAFGSPMYGELIDRIAENVGDGGVFADILAGHEHDRRSAAMPLRLVGGLHRVVLDGRASRLQRWYPSVGGSWSLDGAWPDIVAAARTHAEFLRSALQRPPQTNEVGRSAALAGALLILCAQFGRPVRLFEIGASAGLNLLADRYRYRHAGGLWGPPDARVTIDDAWRGRLPPPAAIRVGERHGYDLDPIQATTRAGELTLLSYVWPDMSDRLSRLRGAIATARRYPAIVHRRTARDAVAGIELEPGALTVLWHSVTWQYLGREERAAVADGIAALGARAAARSPFAHVSMEPQPRAVGAAHEFLVRARSWPGGQDVILAACHPHGPPVNWE
jgi:hypothetical protein